LENVVVQFYPAIEEVVGFGFFLKQVDKYDGCIGMLFG